MSDKGLWETPAHSRWIPLYYSPPLQGVYTRYHNACVCSTTANSLIIHTLLTKAGCDKAPLILFLSLLLSRRTNMLFHCVRDARVNTNVAKYIVGQNYIHTSAITTYSSVISSPI